MRVRAEVTIDGRSGIGLAARMAAASAAVGAAVIALSPMQRASAQNLPAEWLDPSPANEAGQAASFQRKRTAQGAAPGRFVPLSAPLSALPSGAGRTGFKATNPPAPPLKVPSDLPEDTVAAGRRGAPPVPVAIDGSDSGPVARRKPFRKRGESDDPYQPLGIEFGSLLLKPAIELSGGYDSNPAREANSRGGKVGVIAPELKVESDWSRHELRADLHGRYITYPGFQAVPSLDQPSAEGKINGRIDVRRDTRIDLEGRAALTTENPNSPDLPAGVAELPILITRGASAALAHRFNRFELAVGGSFDRTEYGASKLTDGSTVSNADRNYNQQGLRLRGSYELNPGVAPFVEVAADRRIHDAPIDPFGQQRDSTGRQVSVGTTFALTHLLTGSIAVGYAARRYQDPTLPELAGIIADGSLAWSATPITTVTLTARSATNESTIEGVSGVLSRDLGVQVEHAFRRWLVATVKFNYGLDDYVGSPRVDQRYAAAAQLTYKLSREIQIKGEVRREWQRSNAGADYTANVFLLGVRLQR